MLALLGYCRNGLNMTWINEAGAEQVQTLIKIKIMLAKVQLNDTGNEIRLAVN